MQQLIGFLTLLGCCLTGLIKSENLEDPFLLPFGPKHGDQYATREGCSLAHNLDQNFKIGNTTVDKVYVCLAGFMKFSTPQELFDAWLFVEFDSTNSAVVAPFLSRHEIDQRFLDKRCTYTVEENSFYAFFEQNRWDWCSVMYEENFWVHEWLYYDPLSFRPWLNQNENQLSVIKKLHDRDLTEQQLQLLVRDDDEDALQFFGRDSTKYVNLAGNIMRRQVTEGEDLQILTNLIQQREDSADVIVEWALVVTWYKIKFYCEKNDWETQDRFCFASFQLVVTCGATRCFSIFNYFEINGRPQEWMEWKFYCGMFTHGNADIQPSQCLVQTFSHHQLVNGSNVGVKGVWVYELDQTGRGNITLPNQMQNISSENLLTVQNFNNYDDDEPFLLKFGREMNDEISVSWNCYFAGTLQRPLTFGSFHVDYFHVCPSGIISLKNPYESSYSISRGKHKEDTAVIAPILFSLFYRQSQYLDYSCLQYDNRLFEYHIYFSKYDICFNFARHKYNEAIDFDVKSDDESSKALFGVNSTKYVNLAGNVFKREITRASDFETINQLISTHIPDFEATSGYVATWYKIGHRFKKSSFNSFQCIIACSSDNGCVIINDYSEIEWGGEAMPDISQSSGWIRLTDASIDPQLLVNNSNFGQKGIWVFFFPTNGTHPITIFNNTDAEVDNSLNLEKPFLFPFGPDHEDSFTNQRQIHTRDNQFDSRVCSLPQILETPFNFPGFQFDWLFVCLNGVIELHSFGLSDVQEDSWLNEADFFPLTINVFKTDKFETTVRDRQVDYLCALALNASSVNDLYYQYFDDDACPGISKRIRERWNWDNAVVMSGWTDRDTLESVIHWNIEGRHQKNVDFHSDDALSRRIFGVQSTKYVNLANNIFHRESTNNSDLAILTEVIRSDPNNFQFEATWCLVATWYKVSSAPSSDQIYSLKWFNSFQLILVCDNGSQDGTSAAKCFAIYDYYELQSENNRDQVGIFWQDHSGYEIPVEYGNLTTSGNFGSPGRWVFDLSNMSKPLGNISYYGNRKIEDEPFLLPFGPSHGDKFERKRNSANYWRTCRNEESVTSQYYVESNVYEFFTLCNEGFLLTENSLCYDYNRFSNCPYPTFAIYPMEYVNTIDNLIDYMCSKNYFDREDTELTRRQIAEFCPFVTYSHDLEWHENWMYDEDRKNQLGITDEQIEAVEKWNDFLSQNPGDIDIYSDDNLTRAVMGSDTTKYVNLVNNVFKRETRNESDLATLTTFMQPVSIGFQATWAFVATWYKISQQWSPRFMYNSYQAILTCDESSGSSDTPNSCFVIFDYFQIQWTGSDGGREPAHCGVKQDSETFVELPNSGTEEVRNLWAESNVDVPGMWVIELSQKRTENSIQLIGQECRWSVTPEKVLMQAIDTTFTIFGFTCLSNVVPNDDLEIDVIFSGVRKSVTLEGTLDRVSGNITCHLKYWGEAEEVDVTVRLNGVTQITSSSKVLFYSVNDMKDPPPTLTLLFKPNMNMKVMLGPLMPFLGDDYSMVTVKCLFMATDGLSVDIDTYTVATNGTKLTLANSREKSSFRYAVCLVTTATKDEIYSDPVRGGAGLECETWVREEEKRDLRRCKNTLSTWYGCPRETNTRSWWWWVPREDAWYARSEVNDGVMGWQYDVCCNDQNLNVSATVSQNGYCNNCEFSSGADFCIKSIPVACMDGNTDEIHYVSNQCCYAEGRLIEESEPGVGTMHLEESTAGNIVEHFEADLQPFKSCCLQNESTESCDLFYKHRPVIKGFYWSRIVRIARGDPHITTIDNTTYTFNGLNVYTLLKTSLKDQTTIQASTRVSGKGTLFSGLAVQYKDTRLECFITKEDKFAVVINGNEVELHSMRTFTTNNVSITEDSNGSSFTFFFRENGVIIKVLITNSFLNFFTSVPPTFHGKMKGLLGFYDGNPENDLMAANGEIVSVNSSMSTIHDKFGETWSVKEKDWIFKHRPFYKEILKDLEEGSSYKASYTLSFDTPEQEEEARETCKNDTQCLLDVALVGNISMAQAFTRTESQKAVFEVFNQVFQSNVPDAKVFQEFEETSNNTNATNSTDKDPNNNWALSLSPDMFSSKKVVLGVLAVTFIKTYQVFIG